MAAKYAAGTSVPVQRSLMELQAVANKFGAKRFGYATDADRAVVTFEAADRLYRLEVEPSGPAEHRLTPTGKLRDRAAMDRLASEETARRWRSLVLLMKALLVAVDDGLMDTQTALLPWTVLPDGSTLAAWAGPQLEAAYSAHATMPALEGRK